jgi:hypothetical protein
MSDRVTRAIFRTAAALLAALLAIQTAGAAERRLARISCEAAGAAGAGTLELTLAGRELPGGGALAALREAAPGWIAEGRLPALPGLVRLEGRLAGAGAPPLRLELWLHGAGEGAGSLWTPGRREAERLVAVRLEPGGLVLRPAEGGAGALLRLACPP